MRIGLIGSGGREHAIAMRLSQFPGRDTLAVIGGSLNPGIAPLAAVLETGPLNDPWAITHFAVKQQLDLVVVGPEAPLMAGAVDALRMAGFATVGPTQSQARLESDKSFMRDLLRRRVGWGSPQWQVVTSRQEAEDFFNRVGLAAVKPIGLTAGKGVKLLGVHLHDVPEALDYVQDWLRKDGKVLLEERLIGEEFSRIVFVADGRFLPLPVAQDFKYAQDGDLGPMTGGMGAYTCADGSMPFLLPSDLQEADRLLSDVIQAIEIESGAPYRGILYGQFMVTPNGVRVIEFNARFGDPEGINLMALLRPDVDIPALFAGIAAGRLPAEPSVCQSSASVVKYLVPLAYPDTAPYPVLFDLDVAAIQSSGMEIIYSSVQREGTRLRSLGSRAIAVVALGSEPAELSERMEDLLSQIQPLELTHRRDVGSAEMIRRKVANMQHLRGQ